MDTLPGVAAAAAAAAAFGVAAMLQNKATHRVPPQHPGRPALLVALSRQGAWRWSLALTAAAFALQVLALWLVPLSLVQPILVTGLFWSVVAAAVADRRRPDRTIVAGTLITLIGLTTFLAVAAPSGRRADGLDALFSALPLAIGLSAAVAGSLAAAATLRREWRPIPLAVASGICYGATAGLISGLAESFARGPSVVFSSWQTYAIAGLGPSGMLLSQNAFQAGRLVAPALAIITTVDPLVSIFIGWLWLGERLRHDGWYLPVELAALALLIVGLVQLATQAPHVRGAQTG